MKRTSIVVILLAAAVTAAAQARPQHSGLARIGNTGQARVGLSRTMRVELRRAHVAPSARVLAVRSGRTFVRLGGPGNDHCYGVKKGTASQFGFTCWDDFPSTGHPVLDLSTFGADDGGPMHVIDAQGVAADGVATIAFVDAAGAVLGRSSVSGNVYSVSAPPAGAARIVALDSHGRTVFAVPK